jgi:hypothetical protein
MFGDHHEDWDSKKDDHWLDVRETSRQTNAPSGDRGTDGANSSGQQPQDAQLTDAQRDAIRNAQLREYGDAYYDKATEPTTATFVRSFPGVPL